MTGRSVWQGFLDWIRPVSGEATSPHDEVKPTGASSEAVADVAFGSEFGESELLDFLAADLDPIPADPAFREQLREQLWNLVQDGATVRPKNH